MGGDVTKLADMRRRIVWYMLVNTPGQNQAGGDAPTIPVMPA